MNTKNSQLFNLASNIRGFSNQIFRKKCSLCRKTWLHWSEKYVWIILGDLWSSTLSRELLFISDSGWSYSLVNIYYKLVW